MAKEQRRYSDSFREQAVELYLSVGDVRSIREVADELGVHRNVLRRWVKKAATQERPVGESELAELMRLRKENNVLKEELEILKKAAAFFARDRFRT